MKLYRKIILIWAPQLTLVVVAAITGGGQTLTSAYVPLAATGSLSAVVSYFLWRLETERGTGAVFFNF